MTPRYAIPSALSMVASGHSALHFYSGHALAGSLSCTTSPDVVVLRTWFGPTPTVSRGDILDPGWRRWWATDMRCMYWPTKTDRIELLKFVTAAAVAWDRGAL